VGLRLREEAGTGWKMRDIVEMRPALITDSAKRPVINGASSGETVKKSRWVVPEPLREVSPGGVPKEGIATLHCGW